MAKLWIGPTRQELVLLARAARKQGVTVPQFIRREIQRRQKQQSNRVPLRHQARPVSIKLPRERKHR